MQGKSFNMGKGVLISFNIFIYVILKALGVWVRDDYYLLTEIHQFLSLHSTLFWGKAERARWLGLCVQRRFLPHRRGIPNSSIWLFPQDKMYRNLTPLLREGEKLNLPPIHKISLGEEAVSWNVNEGLQGDT